MQLLRVTFLKFVMSSATCCFRWFSMRRWRVKGDCSILQTWWKGIAQKLLRRHPHVFARN